MSVSRWATPRPTARPRLLRRMDEGAALSVVWGPTGCGKTTLIESWLATQRDAVVIRIDAPADGAQPVEYWARVDESIGSDPDPATVLVLDLPDRLSDPALWNRLNQVRRLGGGIRVIVAVRDASLFWDAKFPTVDLSVVTAAELRYTAREVADLFDESSLELAPRTIAELHRRTSGHAVLVDGALRVARVFGTDLEFEWALADDVLNQMVDRYVLSSVLDESLEGRHRVLAMVVASARRVTTAAAAQLGAADAAADLSALERAGVLVRMPAVDGHDWRMVPAVRRSLLRHAVRERVVPVQETVTRLALMSLDAGEYAAALWYATEAEDWELVGSIVSSRWLEISTTRLGALRDALIAMPQALVLDRPALYLTRELLIRMQSGAERGPVSVMSERVEIEEIADRSVDEALLAGTVRSVLMRFGGDFEEAVRHHSVLAEISTATADAGVSPYLPLFQLHWGLASHLKGDFGVAVTLLQQSYSGAADRGPSFAARNAAGQLALHHAMLGEPCVAERWIRNESRFGEAPGWMGVMVRIPAITAGGLSALDRMDLEAAATALAEIGDVDDNAEIWAFIAYTQSQLDLVRGDVEAGSDRLRRATARFRRWLTPNSLAAPLLGSASMDLRTAMGGADEVRVRVRVERMRGPVHPLVRLSGARAAVLSGGAAAALAACRELATDNGGYTRIRLEALLISAMALIDIGDTESIRGAWSRAVALSQDSGLVRPFATVPPETLAVLSELGPPVPEAWRSLDVALRPHVFPAPPAAAVLTERERAVLAGLATTATVAAIAQSLYVSPNTVKTQMRSIYRKLTVHSRGEAVAAARRLGLL
ncbi:LuxR C-terminal-related transcriptional regulator [Rhodococcus sp. NPDC059234]|uniref:LuxR C-terminal-related transcriptional regulator n=1 Tax=Rhodococcus sp. NPDC059234 TaxID=3346781 RepID=UPI00366E3AE7